MPKEKDTNLMFNKLEFYKDGQLVTVLNTTLVDFEDKHLVVANRMYRFEKYDKIMLNGTLYYESPHTQKVRELENRLKKVSSDAVHFESQFNHLQDGIMRQDKLEQEFRKDLFNLHAYVVMNRKSIDPESQDVTLNEIALAFKAKEGELAREQSNVVASIIKQEELTKEVKKQKRWRKSAIWAWLITFSAAAIYETSVYWLPWITALIEKIF